MDVRMCKKPDQRSFLVLSILSIAFDSMLSFTSVDMYKKQKKYAMPPRSVSSAYLPILHTHTE